MASSPLGSTGQSPSPAPASGLRLRPEVQQARQRLREGREKLRAQHESGSPGVQVSAHLTDLLDTILRDLFEAVVENVGDASFQDDVALVAHGGYGRREMAPYSDVDLMLLYQPCASERIAPLARQLTHHVYDAGMQMGFSVRTPEQALALALRDATILTSLVESRCLSGSSELFQRFFRRFARSARARSRRLLAAVEVARRDESGQYGETVYLLQPNIKRSQGGLRDLHLIRWIGFVRHGVSDPEHLSRAGLLAKEDFLKLRDARDFLLRLRNELHFRAQKSQDILLKDEQLRLADLYGYQGDEGLLPVEQFMREYFAHTSEVHYIASNFAQTARTQQIFRNLLGPLFSHQVEGDFWVGPRHIKATRRGLAKLRGDLAQVLRLMDLANMYNKRIDHTTWVAIREDMMQHTESELTPQTVQRFLSLISQPAQLGELLRRLHQLRALEKIIPGMRHARCLLQFNEYHKYTVDEHSIRAVECATEFLNDSGILGEVYRGIKHKRTLHLALLMHDMGKGYAEDHSEVGRRLAGEAAVRLQLPPREAEVLRFLVHKHLHMSRLALWRDIGDEALVVQFAVDVGSPDVLQMLFILSCADLAAVGPGVLNEWKLTLLTDLYHRAMNHLAGERAVIRDDQNVSARRRQLRESAQAQSDREWWEAQIRMLPSSFLLVQDNETMLQMLQQLKDSSPRDAHAWGRYLPQQNAVEYTVGTYEQITPGVFHKLTGALSSQGLQILSAEIHTLAHSLVLDRFCVHDKDYAGPPPEERLQAIQAALLSALKDPDHTPTFRRLWKSGENAGHLKGLPTRVRVDNSTAERFTILDIFTHDRMGLLYTISRTLFELGLSVHVAKIGTHVDQVVDVFYVTDQAGNKVDDERRLHEIRERLLAAIEPPSEG